MNDSTRPREEGPSLCLPASPPSLSLWGRARARQSGWEKTNHVSERKKRREGRVRDGEEEVRFPETQMVGQVSSFTFLLGTNVKTKNIHTKLEWWKEGKKKKGKGQVQGV